MSAAYRLREDSEAFDRDEERLTADIEHAEEQIVTLRRRRDEVRFNRLEARAAADFLDNAGFKVERDPSGSVTVSVYPPAVTSDRV